jgi:dihydrofolate reductase
VVRGAVAVPDRRPGGQVVRPSEIRRVVHPPGPDWNNSTVLTGDVVEEASKLKRELHGQILVLASFQLVRSLMEHDLVDELRLKIYPVVLGAGERLFGETSDARSLRLVGTETLDGDVTFLTFERRP